MMVDKFNDTKNLIFDGYLKETVKFDKFIVVIRTLSVAEEDFVVNTYENLSTSYNAMAAVDTIQRSIYSINGCIISQSDDSRGVVRDWPQQTVILLFKEYLKLVHRANVAADLLEEFAKTDESKLRWSVVKSTKTSLNSAVITGNPDFENQGLTSVQQAWVYINMQNDAIEKHKIDWAKTEYMTDTICTFINPIDQADSVN